MTSLALHGAALPSSKEGATSSQQAAAPEIVHTDNNCRWLCVVCLEEEKEVLLLPCSHLCLCSACAQSIMASTKQCPVCRSAIATTHRTFT